MNWTSGLLTPVHLSSLLSIFFVAGFLMMKMIDEIGVVFGVLLACKLSVCRLKINLKIFKVLSSGLSLCIFVGLRFEIKSA